MQLKSPPSPTTTDETNSDIARVSTLNAGGDINLLADGDVTLEGTQVDAGADIGISAENINILSATDTVNSNHQTSYQQTGLNLSASMSNVSITAGLSKNDSETDNSNTTAIGSN